MHHEGDNCPDCGHFFPRNDSEAALEFFNVFKTKMGVTDGK